MRNRLFILAGILIILCAAALGWGWKEYSAFVDEPLAVSAEGSDLNIAPGATVSSVARQLQALGMLQDARLFSIMVRLHGKGSAIKAGEYFIVSGTTPRQLLQQL